MTSGQLKVIARSLVRRRPSSIWEGIRRQQPLVVLSGSGVTFYSRQSNTPNVPKPRFGVQLASEDMGELFASGKRYTVTINK